MKKTIEIKTLIDEFDSMEEMSSEDQSLIKKAIAASEKAYAPYSNFHVGAALLLENGVVITGNNQENIAYPSGLCAERVAIYAAGASYPGIKFKTLAVTAYSTDFEVAHPIAPCGACRQAIAEYEMRYNSNVRIIMSGKTGKVQTVENIKCLLPLIFQESGLLS